MLGNDYSLMASNETLKSTIEKYCSAEFKGDRANKRPDLLLSQGISDKFLLVEFKRPSHKITRDDENQAVKYRDDLFKYLGRATMDIIVVGGSVDTNIDSSLIGRGVKLIGYDNLISKAKTELNWLLKELQTK